VVIFERKKKSLSSVSFYAVLLLSERTKHERRKKRPQKHKIFLSLKAGVGKKRDKTKKLSLFF